VSGIIEMEEDLLRLPFDMFQRYQAVRNVIERVRTKEKLSIIDVGGSPGYMAKFLPKAEVIVIDVKISDGGVDIRADGCHLPIRPGSCDMAISIDTLEHISKPNRPHFLDELLRVTADYVIVAAPFSEKGVAEAEQLVYDFADRILIMKNEFLAEHIQYGIPDLEDVLQQLSNRTVDTALIPNGFLGNWIQLMLLDHLMLYLGAEELRKEFSCFYNSNFYRFDNREPSYRKVIIARKRGSIPSMDNLGAVKLEPKPALPSIEMNQFLVKLLSMKVALKTRDDAIVFLKKEVDNLHRILKKRDEAVRFLQDEKQNLATIIKSRDEAIFHLKNEILNLQTEVARLQSATYFVRMKLAKLLRRN